MNQRRYVLTIGIPAYEEWEKLDRLLGNLGRQRGTTLVEIIVVDDAHPSNLASRVLAAYPDVIVYRNTENRGPAFSRNLIICQANGRYVAFLDADCEVPPDWVEQMLPELAPNRLISGRVVRPDGSTEWGPRRSSPLLGVSRSSSALEANVASSNNMVVERELALQIGGFNEDLKIYFEDSLFSLEARRSGAEFRYLPQIAVVHHHHSLIKPERIRLQTRNTLWSMYHFHAQSLPRKVVGIGLLILLYLFRTGKNLLLANTKMAAAYWGGLLDAIRHSKNHEWRNQWLSPELCRYRNRFSKRVNPVGGESNSWDSILNSPH